MKKGTFYFWVLLFLPAFVRAQGRDLGADTVQFHSPCSFHGGYVRGEDYDISPYLSEVEVSVFHPYLLKIVLKPESLTKGTYVALSFYDPKDKAHGPIADLSHTGTDKQIAASSFLQFRAYKASGGELALAPVIYKKGVRERGFYNPFAQADAVTDESGQFLGGSGNLFSKIFVTVAGKGTYPAKDFDRKALPDKDGKYTFFLHLSPSIGKRLLIIAAITKASLLPSGRGLRSPIPILLDISRPCKK